MGGRSIFEIVGVAPESFTGTETGTVTDIFLPMAMKNPRTLASANNFWLRTLVQLKPGVAAEPVHQMLSATYRAAEEERAKEFYRNAQAASGSSPPREAACWSPRAADAPTCRETTAGR